MASTLSTLACCAADVGMFAWREDSAKLLRRQALGQETSPNVPPIVRHFDFRNYRVRQVAKLTNADTQLTQMDIWLPVARSDHEQRVGGLELTAPARRLPERLAAGDLARHLSTESLPKPGESWEFVVEYPVSVARVETDLDRLLKLAWRDWEDRTAPARYLRREKLIETNEPRLPLRLPRQSTARSDEGV